MRQYLTARFPVTSAALFAALLCSLPAAASAQARSLDVLSRVENTADAQRQAEYVAGLERFAASRAPRDSVVYWQIIRANLAQQKRALVESGERSLGAGPQPAFRMPKADERAPIDTVAIEALKSRLRMIKSGERIFGGRPVFAGEYDEVVSLAMRKGEVFKSFCSGTHIAPGTVLTAAHCVCDAEFDGPSGTRPVIVFGTNVNRSETILVAFESRSRATRLKGFCAKYTANLRMDISGRDLAVVKFTPNEPMRGALPKGGLKIARIASAQLIFGLGLEELDLVGFGYTSKRELGEKQFTTTGVADKICRASTAQQYGCAVGKETVAIDYEKKRDTCMGDSGGPAFMRDGADGYYLTAVTSRGLPKGGKCGEGGVYSLVTPDVVRWLATDHAAQIATCDAPDRCATAHIAR